MARRFAASRRPARVKLFSDGRRRASTHSRRPTHEVLNQAPPLEGYNVFERNRPLVEALRARGRAAGPRAALAELGELAGGEAIELGPPGQREPAGAAHPRPLRAPHRRGRVPSRLARADGARGRRTGSHALPWREPQPGRARRARGAVHDLLGQVEGGHRLPDLDDLLRRAGAARSSPSSRRSGSRASRRTTTTRGWCPASEKAGALCGMAMTEKQGGSDVRANTTVARPLNGGGPGAEYELDRPQVVLLRADVRRLPRAGAGRGRPVLLPAAARPAGRQRNRFHIQRLKDKLGNRSNASSEVEFDGAWARLIGEEGRGVPTIIEMVNHTRLDCVLGSTTGMRAGGRAGHPPRRAPVGFRQAAGRPAADAQRPRGPLHRVRGGDGDGDAPRARLRRSRRATSTSGCSSASPPPSPSTGSASAARSTRSRRSSAWAATATSRSRACRGSTARRRSTRSGRDRAT